jgi:hypothetical protein
MITENETPDDAPKKALIYICGGNYKNELYSLCLDFRQKLSYSVVIVPTIDIGNSVFDSILIFYFCLLYVNNDSVPGRKRNET